MKFLKHAPFNLVSFLLLPQRRFLRLLVLSLSIKCHLAIALNFRKQVILRIGYRFWIIHHVWDIYGLLLITGLLIPPGCFTLVDLTHLLHVGSCALPYTKELTSVHEIAECESGRHLEMPFFIHCYQLRKLLVDWA